MGFFEGDQSAAPLFEAVKRYAGSGVTPFHVPGHKQGRGIREFRDYIGKTVLRMDANGMDDLDYLNNPSGAIMESQRLFARAFGADEAFFLVNGTTSGVQAMIISVCGPGDEIILPRNAHKSAINGIILSGAVPVFVQPEINAKLGIATGVTARSVGDAVKKHPGAKAVFVINPTYYGHCADIKTIADIAHGNGMAVLADEAHGTHLYFHPELPCPAISAGADISALSVHKTGGSMTQSSALILKKGLISPATVRRSLDLMQTSSASYVLMCSLDVARKQLALRGEKLIGAALELAREGRARINGIEGLYAFGREMISAPGCFDFDETKLGVNVGRLGLSGYGAEALLRREYGIQAELSDLNNILFIVSLGDRRRDISALVKAFRRIARNSVIRKPARVIEPPGSPEMAVIPRDAFYSPKKTLPLESCEGEIAGEMVMAYPPGIPVLCIGERITKDVVDYIKILKQEKCELQGACDKSLEHIRVLDGVI